jgi:carbon monoxide dehydrogenase subunit G
MSVVTREIKVNSTPERVWEVLSDYNGIANWSPSVQSAEGTTSNEQGIGAARACEVAGLGDIEETVIDWKDGKYLTVDLTPFGPMKFARSTWSVRASDSMTIVRATMNFQAKFGVLGTLMEKMIMRSKFSKVLGQSLEGLRYYCETGEKVGEGLPVNISGEPPVEITAWSYPRRSGPDSATFFAIPQQCHPGALEGRHAAAFPATINNPISRPEWRDLGATALLAGNNPSTRRVDCYPVTAAPGDPSTPLGKSSFMLTPGQSPTPDGSPDFRG